MFQVDISSFLKYELRNDKKINNNAGVHSKPQKKQAFFVTSFEHVHCTQYKSDLLAKQER